MSVVVTLKLKSIKYHVAPEENREKVAKPSEKSHTFFRPPSYKNRR